MRERGEEGEWGGGGGRGGNQSGHAGPCGGSSAAAPMKSQRTMTKHLSPLRFPVSEHSKPGI